MTTSLKRGALGGVALAALVLGALLLALAQRDAAYAANVSIGDNFYSPAAVTVPVGEAVNWSNTGALPHTVTAAEFDSGILNAGGSFSFTPTAAGTINYSCTVHPGQMSGTITVTAGGGGDGGGGDGGGGGGGGGGPTAPTTGLGGGALDSGSDSWFLVLAGTMFVLFSGLTAVYLARPRR
jgi:plastocyanin